jgi:hypothetical protein
MEPKYPERRSIPAAGTNRAYNAGISATPAEIEAALEQCGGNAYAAGRLLGCSKTPIRNFIEAERAKGRSIGNSRFNGTRIERSINSRAAKKEPRRRLDPVKDREFVEAMRQLAADLGVSLR